MTSNLNNIDNVLGLLADAERDVRDIDLDSPYAEILENTVRDARYWACSVKDVLKENDE